MIFGKIIRGSNPLRLRQVHAGSSGAFLRFEIAVGTTGVSNDITHPRLFLSDLLICVELEPKLHEMHVRIDDCFGID